MAYQQKTLPDAAGVSGFLARVEPEKRRHESEVLVEMLERLTGERPALWGTSILGFGSYDYVYDSGHSGTSCRIGFSPRKGALTIYIVSGLGSKSDLLAKLGPHTTGQSCLYVKDLAKIDLAVLGQICAQSLAEMDERHPR